MTAYIRTLDGAHNGACRPYCYVNAEYALAVRMSVARRVLTSARVWEMMEALEHGDMAAAA